MYKLLLCWRYLLTRRLALACIISVMLGVATLIVVNSVMSGFSTKLKERLHGLLADVILESHNFDGFADPEEKIEQIRNSEIGPKIAAMTPAIEIQGLIQMSYRGQKLQPRPVHIIGIDAEGRTRIGSFAEFLTDPRNREHPSFKLSPEAKRWHDEHWAPLPNLPFDRVQAPLGQAPPPDMPELQRPELAGVLLGYAIGNMRRPKATGENDRHSHEKRQRINEQIRTSPVRLIGVCGEPLGVVPTSQALEMGRKANLDLVEIGPDEQPPVCKLKDKDFHLLERGDEVVLYTISGQKFAAVYDSVVVADFIKTEMSEYDSNFVYVPLEWLQQLRTMQNRATCMQIKLKDYADAKEVVEHLQSMFPEVLNYRVETWEDKQGPLLAAISIEKGILNILLFLIIGVAGFGILAIFAMIVVEKTRDIGILKALGASNGGVMKIFLGYGFLLGLVGAGLGTFLGLEITININGIESFLAKLTGHEIFDRKIYYFDKIPTDIQALSIALVNVGAVGIAILFSVLPALKAAMLHPVRALRYE